MKSNVIVREQIQTFCGWPTDTIALDCEHAESPRHTLILFLPGNPGLIHFYTPMLTTLLQELGVGYSVRATSYAGHGFGDLVLLKDSRPRDIAWTIDGQVQHKLEWVQSLLLEFEDGIPNLIFLSHSIGSYLVQRILLCHTKIAHKAILVIHLMPFIRFDPEPWQQKLYLNTVATLPSLSLYTLQLWSRLASIFPISWLDFYMKRVNNVEVEHARSIAVQLLRQPPFAMNFLQLGLDEFQRLPRTCDIYTLRQVATIAPTCILYAGGPDPWAPLSHMQDFLKLKKNGTAPIHINTTYMDSLRHGFVVMPEMIPPVIDYICNCILYRTGLRCKL